MPWNAMKIQTFFLFFATLLMAFPQSVSAQESNSAFSVTGFPIPRFVSLSSDKIYMRSGPGTKYPVLWEYNRKGLPVEVVMEFDVWRKIRDQDGDQGWVHKSLISGKRTAIAKSDDLIELKRKADNDARLMAYLEPGAILDIQECEKSWCYVSAQGYSGWVERNYLWGIYESEIID